MDWSRKFLLMDAPERCRLQIGRVWSLAEAHYAHPRWCRRRLSDTSWHASWLRSLSRTVTLLQLHLEIPVCRRKSKMTSPRGSRASRVHRPDLMSARTLKTATRNSAAWEHDKHAPSEFWYACQAQQTRLWTRAAFSDLLRLLQEAAVLCSRWRQRLPRFTLCKGWLFLCWSAASIY